MKPVLLKNMRGYQHYWKICEDTVQEKTDEISTLCDALYVFIQMKC